MYGCGKECDDSGHAIPDFGFNMGANKTLDYTVDGLSDGEWRSD